VLSRHYQKIALIIRLKAVERILLIRARLKLIELATNIFMLEVQQGQESFIPKELCQDSLPKCYKFYDPILLIIQDKIPEDRKEYFYSRNCLNLKNYKDNDTKAILYQKFLAGDKNSKLTFKHHCVNEKCRNEIDHT
jgi:hypothetical protein